METKTAAAAAAAATPAPAPAAEPWCLYVFQHRVYMQQQLQRGLRLLAATEAVEEASTLSAAAAAAPAAPPAPFMELQEQQNSFLNGLYWILCCLALLQPAAATAGVSTAPEAAAEQQQHTECPPYLSAKIKDILVNKVILRCMRRPHVCNEASASPALPCGLQTAAAAAAASPEKVANTTSRMAEEAAALPDATSAVRTAGEPAANTTTPAQAAAKPTRAVTAAAANAASDAAAKAVCCTSVLGFSSSPTEDAIAAALPTCSGLQALALLGALPLLPEETLQQLRRFVLLLQRREDGAFANTLPPCCCSGCNGKPAAAPAPAAWGAWEHEGDVRCTFCCLLSLKLLHAAATAQRRTKFVSACASVAAADAGVPAAERTPKATRPAAALFVGGSHIPFEENYGCPGGQARFLNDDSWAAFLLDPFAGVRVEETARWLLSLLGTDGGVGVSPGAEAHAGAAFCFAACLALLGKTHALGEIKEKRLVRWLKERQLPGGSLQGRPGKAGDSCYTFWVVAALLLLGKQPLHLLQPDTAAAAVAAAQHPTGGISRAPAPVAAAARTRCFPTAANEHKEAHETLDGSSNSSSSGGSNPLQFLSVGVLEAGEEQLRQPDPFHTFFALAGLSLLAHSGHADSTGEQQHRQQKQQHRQQEHQHQQQEHQQQEHQQQSWQASCRQLLQPLDPSTALPLSLSRCLMGGPLPP